jgi:hypothetical protein
MNDVMMHTDHFRRYLVLFDTEDLLAGLFSACHFFNALLAG